MIRNGNVARFSLPSVTMAYICVTQGQNSHVMAQRFVDSLKQFPPGYPNKLAVICNGGRLSPYITRMFDGLDAEFFPRSNDGWDIGGFIELAHQCPSDMMMCFGESVHFHRADWLQRIVEAWSQFGPGMYGCYASYLTRPHMNTTAFAIIPKALRAYPYKVTTRETRYAFEHGPDAIWRQVERSNLPALLVTWDGVYDMPNWRSAENILWRGDQSNCLVWSNHTLRYMLSSRETKANWEAGADGIRPIPPTPRNAPPRALVKQR